MFESDIIAIIIIAACIAYFLVPIWFITKILNKTGFSRWFSIIYLIPIVNIIALWVFAFVKWPMIDKKL